MRKRRLFVNLFYGYLISICLPSFNPILAQGSINFDSPTTSIPEAAIQPGNACRPSVEVNIGLTISGNPSQPFTTYFSVAPTSTATAGTDFELITDSLIYAPGDDLQQSVKVLIYDDAYVDKFEIETLILQLDANQYTGNQHTHTLSIQDDDLNPLTDSTWMTVFEEDFEGPFVFGDLFQDTLWALGYFMTSQNIWMAGPQGAINGNKGLYISSDNSSYHYQTSSPSKIGARMPKIEAPNASKLLLEFDYQVAGQVGRDYGSVGYREALLTYSFFDGTPSGPYVNQPQPATRSIELPDTLGSSFYLMFAWENDQSGGTQPPLAIDDVKVKSWEPISVATRQGDIDSAYLSVGETAHFYSANNQIIASIQQQNGTPAGCIRAEIDQEGTGTTIIPWAGDYVLTEKNYFIAADKDTLTEITLYFTAEEIAALGPDPSAFNLLKSDGPISQATASNSEIIPASEISVTTFGPTNAYYAFTTTVDGFSGFALTNAPQSILPVELISLTGEATSQGHLIAWQTLQEQHNDYFTLERSSNGSDFSTLVKIPGAGESDQRLHYEFLDTYPETGVNYYRLSQTDFDGRTTRIGLIAVTNSASKLLEFEIAPNPTNADFCFIKGDSEKDQALSYQLFDASGRKLMDGVLTLTKGSFSRPLPLPLYLRSGLYLLIFKTGGSTEIRKVIIK